MLRSFSSSLWCIHRHHHHHLRRHGFLIQNTKLFSSVARHYLHDVVRSGVDVVGVPGQTMKCRTSMMSKVSYISSRYRHLFSTSNTNSFSSVFRHHVHRRCFSTNGSIVTNFKSIDSSEACSSRVSVVGWIENARRVSKHLTFISIRDSSHNLLQIRSDFDPTLPPLESLIRVDGVVRLRPEDQRTKDSSVEIESTCIEIVSKAQTTTSTSPSRHMVLRKSKDLQMNLKVRSAASLSVRNYLNEESFVEVETPTLFKSTPEGAREFLVPSRKKGKFYALTQSPQQYKQILMSGGVSKYFQFARCYRDETGRADRQPEFTQIDLEMSFVNMDDVRSVAEGIVRNVFQSGSKYLDTFSSDVVDNFKFPIMTFDDAMNLYGTDKPDLRYDLSFFPTSSNSRGICATNLGSVLSRKKIVELVDTLQTESSYTLSVLKGHKWMTRPCDFVNIDNVSSSPEDLTLILSSSSSTPSRKLLETLGRIRTFISSIMIEHSLLTIPKDQFEFVWIVDFPLFEKEADEDGHGLDLFEERSTSLVSAHHPFTAPIQDNLDLSKLSETQLLELKAKHYDLVLNGSEIGGGSIRLHDAESQRVVLRDVLGLSEDTIEGFSHLLNALSDGCPPHGGIALGLDRLLSIMCDTDSIRDVIAFPKSANGFDLMVDCPSSVSEGRLEEYHIGVVE